MDAFQVKFKYTATWSDRYAVHPCTINLYDTGKGVGANGKMIPSADWWVPSPTMLQKTDETVTHAKDLKVMHTATDAVVEPCDGKDGAMKCPWPKQLFLQEEVVLTATKSSSWNMNQHPFDVQVTPTPTPTPTPTLTPTPTPTPTPTLALALTLTLTPTPTPTPTLTQR